MPLLVTSASGENGNGYGALLAFELDGRLRGTFIDDDRIVDPRGVAVDPKEKLLFLNSGADRVVAISSQGRIVRDTGGRKIGDGDESADARRVGGKAPHRREALAQFRGIVWLGWRDCGEGEHAAGGDDGDAEKFRCHKIVQ